MPLLRVWAPGRVNLIGEHTDYSGGLVLPCAIDRGITLDATDRADEIVLVSSRFGEAAPIAADGSGPRAAGWARYAQAVAAELALLGRPPVGLRASLESDLPAGAGLSSSAALEVAIALALCAAAGFELESLELAQACRRAELRAVGVPCGILDQAACVLGRAGEAILLDCSTLAYELVAVPARARLLVIDSGIERSLEHTEYATRREEVERALGGARDEIAVRRLRHVRTENERVHAFAAALAEDDLERAGQLLLESHASLRDDFEVSLPAIDRIVEEAVASGAYGARIHGGGFGGAVLALADADSAAAIEGAMTVAPGAGAHVES